MKKRIGAALLSFAMLAALFVPSVIPARAEADNAITPVLTTTEAKEFAVRDRKDAIITDVQLLQSEKETLTVSGGTVSGSIQWQIRVQGDVWANISGANDTSLEVSYALVANLLNGGTAALRCKRTDADGKTETTPAVTVRIRIEAQPAKAAPALGTVLAGAKPLGEAVISQANAPTAQPEKTAQPSAAPTETPASSPAAETAAPSAPAQTNAPGETKAPALVKAAAPILQAKPAAETQTAAPTAEAKPAAETQTAAPTAEAKPAAETQTAAPTAEAKPTADTKGSTESDPAPANDPTESDTPAPSLTTYTILIQYQFADGTQAANPWSATVATGSTYTQDIQSPVVVGYTPDQPVVHVNTSEGKIYTVTYQPAKVEFTVKHYQQNVSNDEYTLADTETKEGFTESAVGDNLAKTDYTGFYSLLYDTTTTIAADGSTVVEVYYDRYYYLMNFDLDGGYGVEPIYARFGAPIIVDKTALKKPGYTFEEWDKEIPATMPAENTSYKAKWIVGEKAKVTVVVWGENPDDEGYSFYKKSEIHAKPGDKLTLSDLQGKLICGKEEHKHSNSCGVDCKHTHDLTCYGLRANARPVTPDGEALKYFAQLQGGVQDGYIYYFDDNGYNGNGDLYYLRLNGNYYQYSAKPTANIGKQIGNRVSCDEGFLHSTDYFYKYNLKVICVHTHTDSCYTCGKEEHTHTSACYYNTSFMDDPDLWKLVRSDEVPVAADGTSIINVYYDRVEFTLHFRKANSGTDDYGTITKKWGANIREAFNQKCKNAGTSNWSERKDAEGPWTSYLDIMPAKGRTYYAYKEGSGTSTAYYYVEGLDGKDTLFYKNESTGSGYTVTVEEFIEISGFTFDAERSAKVGDYFDGAKFYYTRNSYKLRFYNHDTELTDKAKTVKYEAPLSGYNFTPDYPANLEKNAFVFDGWYTTAGCYEGSKADLSTMAMPASDVILYAKWVPKTHTVKTYLTKDVLDNSGDPMKTWTAVPHGTAVTNPPAEPVNGQYTFVGWFYISDTGEEKAFNFSMPVNRDLKLYAKWSSNTLMSYTVKYELENGTQIAPPTTGSALAGSTKTFNAKTGTQLNEGYQSGYFPGVSSHSITIDIEGNAENKKNEFTFVYVAKQEVTYTVKYLEKGTSNQLADPKIVTTRDAVVTETFKQISGYAPDAYQKQLVLAAEGNEIIFWYVKDGAHAPLQIIHSTQNIEGEGYTEYQSSTNLNGVIGTEYSETPLTIAGFTYNGTKSNASGELTAAGLVLNLYYDRIEYPYEFRFLEQGTDKELADPVTGNARYQAQVTQTAKTIPGYTRVSTENQSINVAIEDPANVANKNVRTFYYTEQTVEIKYEVVGPTGCGTLDNYQETQLKVTSGAVEGSTPTATDGFKFVGWYKDEECTQPVDADWVKDSKLTPDKTKNYGTDEASVMGYEAATYYAKFEYDVADLTITKQGCENIDENQSFIFDVTGPNGYRKRVVINGNGSVTIKGLKIGTYTITEVTNWSWRYTADKVSQNITLQPAQTNAVTFKNTRSNGKWLGGDAYRKNIFGN